MRVKEYDEDRQPQLEEPILLQLSIPVTFAQVQSLILSSRTPIPSLSTSSVSLPERSISLLAAGESQMESTPMEALDEDSMTITRNNEHPDIYLTMTVNPRWLEIMKLDQGEKCADYPEIVARVFHLKRKAIEKEICERGIFGGVVAHVYTIEFQKHGLLMHALFYLKDCDKMEYNESRKNFSRGWCDQRTKEEDGYPTYRCRDIAMVLGKIDKIQQYIDGPSEAIWLPLGFEMQVEVPNVESQSRGRILFLEEGVGEASQPAVVPHDEYLPAQGSREE